MIRWPLTIWMIFSADLVLYWQPRIKDLLLLLSNLCSAFLWNPVESFRILKQTLKLNSDHLHSPLFRKCNCSYNQTILIIFSVTQTFLGGNHEIKWFSRFYHSNGKTSYSNLRHMYVLYRLVFTQIVLSYLITLVHKLMEERVISVSPTLLSSVLL